MKVESKPFTVNSTNVAIILDDDTLQVQHVSFLVVHATSTNQGASAGTSDGLNNHSRSTLKYGSTEAPYTSNTYSITHYKRVSTSNVRKLAGVVTDLSEPGMIYMEFDNYDPTLTVIYVATGV